MVPPAAGKEEFPVDIAPTAEVTGFSDRHPEDRAIASPDVAERVASPKVSHNVGANSRRPSARLPKRADGCRRMQRIFTWRRRSIHPAGAPYRTVVKSTETALALLASHPSAEEWQRSYRELAQENLAGNVDTIFFIITAICIVAVFITALTRRPAPSALPSAWASPRSPRHRHELNLLAERRWPLRHDESYPASSLDSHSAAGPGRRVAMMLVSSSAPARSCSADDFRNNFPCRIWTGVR